MRGATECAERENIFHLIPDTCALFGRFKRVAMAPQYVLPFLLLVNEKEWRLVGHDYGPPADRHSQPLDPLFNTQALTHLERRRSGDFENSAKRCDLREVVGIFETAKVSRMETGERIGAQDVIVLAQPLGSHGPWPAELLATDSIARQMFTGFHA